jgi:hypothetical protein
LKLQPVAAVLFASDTESGIVSLTQRFADCTLVEPAAILANIGTRHTEVRVIHTTVESDYGNSLPPECAIVAVVSYCGDSSTLSRAHLLLCSDSAVRQAV